MSPWVQWHQQEAALDDMLILAKSAMICCFCCCCCCCCDYTYWYVHTHLGRHSVFVPNQYTAGCHQYMYIEHIYTGLLIQLYMCTTDASTPTITGFILPTF